MSLTKWQRVARKAYAAGDLAHTKPADFDNCGDTLFSFVMSELGEKGLKGEEALRRIEKAQEDLETVAAALRRSLL